MSLQSLPPPVFHHSLLLLSVSHLYHSVTPYVCSCFASLDIFPPSFFQPSFLFLSSPSFLPSTSSPFLPHVSFTPQWSPYRLQTGPEHRTRRPSMHNGSGWMGQPRNTASSTHVVMLKRELSIISPSIFTSDMIHTLLYGLFSLVCVSMST